MVIVNLIIDAVLVIITLHQVLYWVYLWQMKEYRIDRFRAGLRTWDDKKRVFLESYDLLRWFRPKLTVRSLVSVAVGLIWSLGALVTPNHWDDVAAIVFSPVFTAISMAAISPMFWVWKEETMKKAAFKMRYFKGKVIGVTGSYGKSMTKELLVQVLSQKYKVVATAKNNNSEIGIALTVMKSVHGDEDFFVVEMGAYKTGEIKRSCAIVHPNLGIITGIGDQHLDMFGSLEKIREAKFELIDGLKSRSDGFVGGEDFKLTEAGEIKTFRDHVEFMWEKQKFSVPLLGKNLVRNVVGVAKVCQKLGFSSSEIASGVARLNPELVYPKVVPGKKGTVVIDNSYNSSLESFLSAIDYLETWGGYKKIVVTRGMIELGENSIRDHKLVGQELRKVDQVLVISASYFDELNASGNAKLVTNFNLLIRELAGLTSEKTLILFQNLVPRVVIDSVLR